MTTRCLRLPRFLCWLCIGLLLSLLSAIAPRHLPLSLPLGATLASDLPAIVTTADRDEGHLASADADIQTTFAQGQQAYDQQDYEGAIALWQPLLPQTSPLQQAVILSNISLAHQALRQWEPAEQSIHKSLALLGWPEVTDIQHPSQLANALDVYGQWLYFQGDPEIAIQRWAEAEQLYPLSSNQNLEAIAHNQLNQAQALQYLGHYLDSQARLQHLYEILQTLPDGLPTTTLIDVRLSLGQILRLVGNLGVEGDLEPNALSVLKEAEALAEAGDRERLSAIYLELGNTHRAIAQRHRRLQASSASNQADTFESTAIAAEAAALAAYQQAIATDPADPLQRIQAQLNQLSFYLLTDVPDSNDIAALITSLQANLAQLPPRDRPSLEARLTFAHHALKLREIHSLHAPSRRAIAEILATVINQAESLNDARLSGAAWGNLGHLYEITYQARGRDSDLSDAFDATNRGLTKLLETQLPELNYRLHWQLGRILKQQGDTQGAILAYDAAVTTIQSLRRELVILNPDVQFSFREDIEPVYREFADLLLNEEEPSQENLKKARETIDFLQTLEVENYLRQSCNTDTLAEVDKVVDEFDTAAFIYSIVLENRLEVILKLPDQEQLLNHKVFNQETWFASVINDLRGEVESTNAPSFSELGKNSSQQVYNWLIKPFQEKLEDSASKHLIFVMDKFFRDIPISVLFDGDKYLIEQPYAASLTPGLQLIQPKPIKERRISSVLMGLSEIRSDLPDHEGFPPLKNVEQEIDEIESLVPATISLNESFTSLELQRIILSSESPILHLATHGKFSANVDHTFLLAWDKRINLKELADILRPRDQNNPNPIELLVLSACETISGGGQAALGLAGLAVQSGVRGSIASFWTVDDEATSQLMASFYRILSTEQVSKSEALRKAQLELLNRGATPYYWSAFTVLGNWL